jgi:hypothetical protein
MIINGLTKKEIDLLKELLKRRIGLYVSHQSEMYTILSKHLSKVPLLYMGGNVSTKMDDQEFKKLDLSHSSSSMEALYFPIS